MNFLHTFTRVHFMLLNLNMTNALEALIAPKTKQQFLENYRKNSPMVSHNLRECTEEIEKLPFLKSIEELLAFWPKTVDCYLPGIADEVNSVTTSTDEALKLFHKGSGLIFNDADTESKLLRKWVDELIRELGLPSMTYGRCLIYAIPAGKVTDPHFDQNINFVYQIHGTKSWWVAENQHVENPLTRHTIGTQPDPELASYTSELPGKFPDNAQEFTLKPRSFLYVPQGAWHTTKAASEDTLSISFTLTAPSWIDLLTAAMRGRLAQNSEWRETANFVNDKEQVDEAEDKLDLLLSELAYEISHWRARDILGATEQR